MKPTRTDVKAILDYLLARHINLSQAQSQLIGLGLTATQASTASERFRSALFSYADVYSYLGV